MHKCWEWRHHCRRYLVCDVLFLSVLSYLIQPWQHTTCKKYWTLDASHHRGLPTFWATYSAQRYLAATAWSWHRWRQEREQKQGKQAGICAGLKGSPFKPPLPSLYVTNTQSMLQKTYELRLRITTHTVNSCVLFFFKTWLNVGILEEAIEPQGRFVYRSDWTAESGGVKCGGMCIYVCNTLCSSSAITGQLCSLDLEFIIFTIFAYNTLTPTPLLTRLFWEHRLEHNLRYPRLLSSGWF